MQILSSKTVTSGTHKVCCHITYICFSTCLLVVLQSCLDLHVVCSQTQYVKPSKQIPTYDAEDVSRVAELHWSGLTLEHPVEFRKQSDPEEGEKSEPEPKETTMTASELAEGLRLIEADAKLPEEIRQATSNN